MVERMAQDTFDSAFDVNTFFEKVRENPTALDDLDLEDYANHLAQTGRPNMKVVLDFIKEEIKKPFEDDRKRSDKKFEDAELFYKLTKESSKSLRKGAIVNARVIAIFEKNIRTVLECGAIGDIFPSDISDRE